MSWLQPYLGHYTSGLKPRIDAEVIVEAAVEGGAPGFLAGSFESMCPATFAESADGILLIANGIDPMMRWDGIDKVAIPAGVQAPKSPVVLTTMGDTGGSADGYVNESFDFSKFGSSRIAFGIEAQKVTAASKQARQQAFNAVEARIRATSNYNAGKAVDAPLTGTALSNYYIFRAFFFGERAFLNGVAYYRYITFSIRILISAEGPSGTNVNDTIFGHYSAFIRYVDKWNNPSDPSPLCSDINIDDGNGGPVTSITYTQVEPPTEARVVKIQFWRTTGNQGQEFFLDNETDDLTTTTYTSTKGDVTLGLQESMVAFSEGRYIARLWGVPPPWKPFILAIQDRMVAAGDRPWRQGSAAVTHGSTTVLGIGTDWSASLIGRAFYAQDDRAQYEVTNLDADAQTLVLDRGFEGSTDPYTRYAIRAFPAERNIDYFTVAGQPEAWPAPYGIRLNEDGDETTGLVEYRGYAYHLKRHSIHRLSFDDFGVPLSDLAVKRGCVNAACAVEVDGVCFCLDDMGVHAFTGDGTSHGSLPIQNLFRLDDDLRICWHESCRFHALHCPGQHLIRWFVCLAGLNEPRHALCYHYRLQRWWLEEFPVPITSSVLATINGRLRPLVGTGDGRICALDTGSLDLCDPGEGDTRFKPSAVGICSVTATLNLEDVAITLAPELVGTTIGIVKGQGLGQWRRITDVTSGVIKVDQPWLIRPTTDSTMQIGGIRWSWVSKEWEHTPSEVRYPRGCWLQFQDTEDESFIEMRMYRNARLTAEIQKQSLRSDGIISVAGEPTLLIELETPGTTENRQPGAARVNRDNWQDVDLPNRNSITVELAGFSGTEKTRITQMIVPGVEDGG